MTNVLVTGSNGQLGSELKSLVNSSNFFFTSKEDLDISKKEEIENFVKKNNINLIINCGAYTAVDKAESEKELANLINNTAVKYLAQIAKENNFPLIHISTDYVFDGKKYIPYKEDDNTNPQGVYGQTKLGGEISFRESGAKGIIIRTSWVYSSFGNNFVKTMLKLSQTKDDLGVIFDQVGTPTYAKNLAEVILDIINKHFDKLDFLNGEIYNFSNEGVCSWYDFAKTIFEIENINIKINPIETKDYPTPAKRPNYSILNKSKIKQEFDIQIPYWKDSLKECLKRLKDKK